MFKIKYLPILIFLGLLASQAKAQGYVVIVNAKLGVTNLSRQELREIYNGDKTFWKNGQRVRAARLGDSDPLTVEFLQANLNESATQFLQAWRHKLFSGRALPPRKIDSPVELMSFVEQSDGAIGFLQANKPITSKSVTVVSIHD